MVKKWMKQLILLEKSTKINFDKIILDIFSWNFSQYDFKELEWYKDLYRIRIWTYRIVFKKENENINILMIWSRWDVYKKLKQIYS